MIIPIIQEATLVIRLLYEAIVNIRTMPEAILNIHKAIKEAILKIRITQKAI
jgi:hypothetical protein